MKKSMRFLLVILALIGANAFVFQARADASWPCWGCGPGQDDWMCGTFGPIQICSDHYFWS